VRTRPPAKSASPGSIGTLLGAIVLVAVGGRLGVSGDLPSVARLDLPDRPFNYAKPDLPEHFRTRLVNRFDNTPSDNPTTDDGATLGRALFYDRRFSSDGTLSCASCHVQGNAFADPNRVSKGVGGRVGDRNAMGLINARFRQSGRFFWDSRAETLEIQVLKPIEDANEMAHDVDKAIDAIRRDPAYPPLFRKAFGDEDIDRDRVAKALAQFVRSIVSYRSKFDDGLAQAGSIAQDFPNFSDAENLGKKIFLGDHERSSRGNCATCHLRNYAFNRPSDRAQQAAIFQPDRLLNNGLDAELATVDNGVGDLTLDPRDYGRFAVPDLRNVELTAPYMHDGRFQTLEEVVEHYNTGVKAHPNLDPQLREGRGRPGPRLMNLDEKKKAALVAFLKTLTDRELVADPKYSDPFR
jgi:cytochrome c peroxidase